MYRFVSNHMLALLNHITKMSRLREPDHESPLLGLVRPPKIFSFVWENSNIFLPPSEVRQASKATIASLTTLTAVKLRKSITIRSG